MGKIERPTVRKRAGTPAPSTAPPKPKGQAITGSEPGEITSITGVLFGPPKTAKTTLACSGKNVLLMSFDPQGDSTETLRGRKDITVVKPRSQAEIDSLITALYTTDRGRFDWIVLDSVTFLFLLLGGKDITDAWRENKDVRRPYGKAGAAVQQIIHDLVLLEDTNVIFTAHLEKEDTDDDDGVAMETDLGENEVKVAVTPMVWRILSGAVSFIGRTYKENTYDKVTENGKTKRNKRTRYAVSFNDGERSPAGSRLTMAGEYEIELDTLDRLATELIGG